MFEELKENSSVALLSSTRYGIFLVQVSNYNISGFGLKVCGNGWVGGGGGWDQV